MILLRICPPCPRLLVEPGRVQRRHLESTCPPALGPRPRRSASASTLWAAARRRSVSVRVSSGGGQIPGGGQRLVPPRPPPASRPTGVWRGPSALRVAVLLRSCGARGTSAPRSPGARRLVAGRQPAASSLRRPDPARGRAGPSPPPATSAAASAAATRSAMTLLFGTQRRALLFQPGDAVPRRVQRPLPSLSRVSGRVALQRGHAARARDITVKAVALKDRRCTMAPEIVLLLGRAATGPRRFRCHSAARAAASDAARRSAPRAGSPRSVRGILGVAPAQPEQQPSACRSSPDLAVALRLFCLPRQRRQLAAICSSTSSTRDRLASAPFSLALLVPAGRGPRCGRLLQMRRAPSARVDQSEIGLAAPARANAPRSRHRRTASARRARHILAIELVGGPRIAGDAAGDVERIGIVEPGGGKPVTVVELQHYLAKFRARAWRRS